MSKSPEDGGQKNAHEDVTPTAKDMGIEMANALSGNTATMSAGRKVTALLGMAAIFGQTARKFGVSREDAMKLIDAALDANEVK